MILLEGKTPKKAIEDSIKAKIMASKRAFQLDIILVGENKESLIYVKNKIKFGERVGAKVILHKLNENIEEKEILDLVNELNENSFVSGIIVQLPLPEKFDKNKILNQIKATKDIDGLSESSIIARNKNQKAFLPATARGVVELMEFYNISIAGKKVVVMGRSNLVGKPIAEIMKKKGAEVFIVHSKTENPKEITKEADILIVAIGKSKFVNTDYIKDNAVIIDVGINSIVGEKFDEEINKRVLVGDVDFESVKGKVFAITPVPGGVGQMTVASLFENLVESEGGK